jgi:hypothetical protein
LRREFTRLVFEVVEEVEAVQVVRADVVIVDRFLDQVSCSDGGVDRSCGRIRFGEERPAVDFADQLCVELDARVRSDDLKIEDDAARAYGADHVVEDVHDVLGSDSSE